MTPDEAVREVGWVARRARELSTMSTGAEHPASDYVEFFRRKIALLEHIGTADSLALIPSNASLLEFYTAKAAR